MTSNTVDNLLYFVSESFDNLDRRHINNLIVDFYKLDELIAAKTLLISECERIGISDSISEFKKKRHNTRSEGDTKQKLSKDILDIWTAADVQKGGQFLTTFTCTDPPRIPSQQPSQPQTSDAENTQQIVTLLLELKKDLDDRKEAIKWLLNVTKNT